MAPIYGLGAAEAELAEFMAKATDIRVATKFGIATTAIGRLAGLTQSPVRQVLRSFPWLNSKLRGPNRGKVPPGINDRVLYSDRDYSVENAQRALTDSLKNMGIARLDYFFLHEPVGFASGNHHDLVEYLEREVQHGRIRHWGPAGDLSDWDALGTKLTRHATAKQCPYDLVDGYRAPRPRRGQPTITYGFISHTLPRVRAVLKRDNDFRQLCSELVDADLANQEAVVRLLVRDAVTNNPYGTVLFSSTKTRHLTTIRAAADAPLPNEARVARMIRQKCRHNAPL